MNFYERLARKKRKKAFRSSEDRYYFLANRHLLAEHPLYRFLMKPHDEFDIIRANIIIRSLENKKLLDEAILYAFRSASLKTEEVADFVHERMTGRPYLPFQGIKVYLPIFPAVINEVYYQGFGKLLSGPYAGLLTDYKAACIDPFETYGFVLYTSIFTRLIPVLITPKIGAFYHFDFRTLYFINDQGRLDARLTLFDRWLSHPDQEEILKRLKPVVTAYLDNDRQAMLQALLDNGLVSRRFLTKIRRADEKRLRRQEKARR